MQKFMAGGLAGIVLITGGLLFWQLQAQDDVEIPPPPPTEAPQGLPVADAGALTRGPAPPEPPQAAKASREQQRFNRYDRNRDEAI